MPTEPYLSGGLRIFLRRTLRRTLHEMHQRGGGIIPFSSFLAELLEAAAADYRTIKLAAADSSPMPPIGAIGPSRETHRFHKITKPETTGQILSLRSEGFSVSALATRFHVGPSSIRRILKERNRNADTADG